MYTLKLTQIGDSLGVIFPTELVAKLKLKDGDEICLTDSPNGMHINLTHSDFEAQMNVGRDIMKEYRAVLQELAK